MDFKCWVEAMRLRTLPVSVAGVVMGWAYAIGFDQFKAGPAILCLVFALLAQIASNFANEYYDYTHGLDRPGREGPRRGVTEGDITPKQMLIATFATLGLACLTGLSLIFFGGWWLIFVGIAVALGVMAYSAGPYPLSHHGLGEVAVLFFFGIIPVNFTYYVQSLQWSPDVVMASISVGLMGANVLIVNNYRDIDDDRKVGKKTLAVILGRHTISDIYLFSGFLAVAFMAPTWWALPRIDLIVPGVYLVAHTLVWIKLTTFKGAQLNPLLGITAALMLIYAIATACVI